MSDTKTNEATVVDQASIVPHSGNLRGGDQVTGYTKNNKSHFVIFRSNGFSGFYLDGVEEETGPNEVLAIPVPSVPWGDADHFCMTENNKYLIKGDKCATLHDKGRFETITMHPDYCGGDHYLVYDDYYTSLGEEKCIPSWVIIFKESGIYRFTRDLQFVGDPDREEAGDGRPEKLSDQYKDGIYYWCLGDDDTDLSFNVLKRVDDWGTLQILQTRSFTSDIWTVRPFPKHLVPFLPGGVSSHNPLVPAENIEPES